ncbi:MAG: hypothetical protein ABI330_18910 [Caldimonas sp.]
MTPSTWNPEFWDQTLLAAKHTGEGGDKLAAETLCAQAIRYVEGQAIRSLYDYSSFLEVQQPGSGQAMHTKAKRLEQVKAEQARATQAGNSSLGFAPWVELDGYADSLSKLHREVDAREIHRLSAAYKYTQEAYIRRTLLLHAGTDPRGEC